MEDRNELLESYVKRLSAGEDLESVRRDFVRNFRDVDASEIMKAEQSLMMSGVSYKDVQRLCDVHSALFHGATREEKIADAEKATLASLKKNENQPAGGRGARMEAKSRMAFLAAIPGHPVNIFTGENEAIGKKIKEIQKALDDENASFDEKKAKFEEIRPLATHYAKKGDLLYPLLNSRYNISGPSQVMWGVDDEIRDEISALCKKEIPEDEWIPRAKKVLTRAEEMIFKEQNILLPICVQNFSDDEWSGMASDIQNYEPCLIEKPPVWRGTYAASEKAGESENSVEESGESGKQVGGVSLSENAAAKEGEIVLPSGHFTKEQLRALLNTLPLEISFVDEKDINRYFNEGPKVFKRPMAALDREVYYCHPPKVEKMVRGIIDQFRAGTRKSFEIWMEKQGQTFLVRYLGVYDENGKFLGTMECVENMEGAKKHFS